MRTLSIDFGIKNIGFAITDLNDKIITPINKIMLKRFNIVNCFENIQYHLKNYWSEIDKVIIGNSANKEFNNNKIVYLQKQLKSFFEENTNMEVINEFEDFTSVESFAILKKLNLKPKNINKYIDSFAAAVMLDRFMSNRGKFLTISL